MDLICRAQENILTHLERLEKELDGEFGNNSEDNLARNDVDNPAGQQQDISKDQNYFSLVKLQKQLTENANQETELQKEV